MSSLSSHLLVGGLYKTAAEQHCAEKNVECLRAAVVQSSESSESSEPAAGSRAAEAH